MKQICCVVSILILFVVIGGNNTVLAQNAPQSDQERVAKLKQTILSRIVRDKVEYRGDPGKVRIKWEWVNQVLANYVYQKSVVYRETSVGEKYDLRQLWVFKNMKITFQEVFNLSTEDDDKLFPLSYRTELLSLTPNSTFEGLTLLGKNGEVKGPFKTRIVINGFLSAYYFIYIGSILQYTNKEGKEKLALGVADDAYTMRWKDIKNRLLDDMTEEKALEDLRLERDKRSADTIKDDN